MLYGVGDQITYTAKSQNINRTQLKYDAVAFGDEDFQSRGFTSFRNSRHSFGDRSLDDVQDDEDRAHGWNRVRLVSGVRDLCHGLEMTLEGFMQPSADDSTPHTMKRPEKKSKKRKLIMRYEDEKEESGMNQLDVKLRKVESKVKFQRELLAPQSKPTDPVFRLFQKSFIPPHSSNPPEVPETYVSKYIVSDRALPISKYTASSILQRRFTSSTDGHEDKNIQLPTTRTIQKIAINPLLEKRLGI
jgi:hypothetical protein